MTDTENEFARKLWWECNTVHDLSVEPGDHALHLRVAHNLCGKIKAGSGEFPRYCVRLPLHSGACVTTPSGFLVDSVSGEEATEVP